MRQHKLFVCVNSQRVRPRLPRYCFRPPARAPEYFSTGLNRITCVDCFGYCLPVLIEAPTSAWWGTLMLPLRAAPGRGG